MASDDLVTLLRKRGWKVCEEAADEIERLRRELDAVADIADTRVALDQERYRHERDWSMPYALNRVLRASMDVAAEIRARKQPPTVIEAAE